MMMSGQQSPQSPGEQAASDVRMPRLSATEESAALLRWFVRAGQKVATGDVLAEIGAGHVTMEVEAAEDGVVAALLATAGPDLIASGSVIARIEHAAPASDQDQSSPLPAANPVTPPPSQPDAASQTSSSTTTMSYAQAMHTAIAAAMRRDAEVFVIGESVEDHERCSAVVAGLAEEFGATRVVGTPITPHAAIGLAVGAAMAGLKPIVEVTAWSLALQALDPIVSSAAKARYRSNGQFGIPMVLRGRNGLWPGAGPLHGVSLASWFAAVPGLKVVCPATPSCAKGLMTSALADPDPVIILEPDALYESEGPVPDEDGWRVPIGAARVAREGRDLTIVTYGQGVALALQAADKLSEEGLETEVVDLRSLRPLDVPAVLGSVRKTGRLLTLSDTVPACSIGAEICAIVATQAFRALKAAPVRIDAADTIVPYAANLEALVLPDADEIAAKASRLVRQAHV